MSAKVWEWPLQGKAGGVRVVEDRRRFEVALDATYFKEKDVQVNVVDDMLEILLEHEERTGRLGSVTRTVNRCYKLPEGVDPKTIRHEVVNNVLYIRGDKK